jgi:hypothetical protein
MALVLAKMAIYLDVDGVRGAEVARMALELARDG